MDWLPSLAKLEIKKKLHQRFEICNLFLRCARCHVQQWKMSERFFWFF